VAEETVETVGRIKANCGTRLKPGENERFIYISRRAVHGSAAESRLESRQA